MWVYEKRLQYPVNITQTNAKLAQVIISQFGGPDGELAASQRYLSQRYTMPDGMTKGLFQRSEPFAADKYRQRSVPSHKRFRQGGLECLLQQEKCDFRKSSLLSFYDNSRVGCRFYFHCSP